MRIVSNFPTLASHRSGSVAVRGLKRERKVCVRFLVSFLIAIMALVDSGVRICHGCGCGFGGDRFFFQLPGRATIYGKEIFADEEEEVIIISQEGNVSSRVKRQQVNREGSHGVRAVSRVNIFQWKKGALIGKGSFGTVYKGMSCDGSFFAAKEVSLLEQGRRGRESVQQLEQEIKMLSQLEHENIVRYLGTERDDSKLYIFLELVTQGSLARLYAKFSLHDSHVSAYTRQILQGLKYLHDKNVAHRDIKSANILLASNETVKLADFGVAKVTRSNDLKSFKGSVFWMAPEVFDHEGKGYGLPADIWSLGCTVLEMLTGHVPYHPLEFQQALYKIWKGVPPEIPDSLSSDARDFIQQCIRVNPNDRPTAAELLEHQFLRRPLNTSLGSELPIMLRRSL